VSFTVELQRLAPTTDTADPAFVAIAALMLDRTAVVIGRRRYRFTEVELYFHGHAHPDPFAHRDPIQRELGRWYFHRSGGTYRGGSYKGVDVTFGTGDGSTGGILVRGLAALDDDELVDGPSLVVDHMLKLTAHASVAELAGAWAGSVDRQLELVAPRGGDVFATARVGLTLRKGATAERVSFLARPYRFLTEPARIRKGRPHLVVALHRQGRAPDDIAAITRCRRAVVDAYIAAFEDGRTRDPASIDHGDDSSIAVCALLGACTGR
jgi:hypothetical protein